MFKFKSFVFYVKCHGFIFKAQFKRRTFHVPNAIQTIDDKICPLINYCLNCIRHMKSSTFEPGLTRLCVTSNLFYAIYIKFRRMFYIKMGENTF